MSPRRYCTATSKRTHQPCRANAMRGREVCYHHGGITTTQGAANTAWKHGRYSKVLPVRLATTYQEALENPDLLSVRHDVAACESRLAELFTRLDSGESGAVWQALRVQVAAFELAMGVGNIPAMRTVLTQMRQGVAQGAGDYAAWGDIREMWAIRCKLTDTEHKTLVAQQYVMTIQEVGALLGAVTHAIQERVTTYADTDTARAILGALTADLAALSTRQAGAGPRPLAQA